MNKRMASCSKSAEDRANSVEFSLILKHSPPDSSAVTPHFFTSDITDPLAIPSTSGICSSTTNSKRRRGPHTFEANPSIRKRQYTRLLKKLHKIMEEFAVRVGQQVTVLVINPTDPDSNRVFGTKPLSDIVRNFVPTVAEEFRDRMIKGVLPQVEVDPSLYPLPPLTIDGIPTAVESMTQAQLRAFIPHMLKYSTLRGKPGWGQESTKPPWWPSSLPWANVRMDSRSEEEKIKISWTRVLREVVFNCYKYHGREDLLLMHYGGNRIVPKKKEDMNNETWSNLHTITNADGTVSIVQIDSNNSIIPSPPSEVIVNPNCKQRSLYEKCYNLVVDNNEDENNTVSSTSTELYLQNNGSNVLQLTADNDGKVYFAPIKLTSSTTEDTDELDTTNFNTMVEIHYNSNSAFQEFSAKGRFSVKDFASLQGDET